MGNIIAGNDVSPAYMDQSSNLSIVDSLSELHPREKNVSLYSLVIGIDLCSVSNFIAYIIS